MEKSEQYSVKCAAVGCDWARHFESQDRFLAFQLQWRDFHNHGGRFAMEARFSVEQGPSSFSVGEEWVFKTKKGRNNNGNKVVATAPNGKVALFDREAPLTNALESNKLVRGVIKVIMPKAVLVTPLEVLGDIPPLDAGEPYQLPKGA